MKIQITLNGALKELRVPPMKRMLDVLREDCGLLGAKEGCGEGECGACAVIMDDALVDTCLIPAIQMAGRRVDTVEGLAAPKGMGDFELDDLQKFFLEEGAVHCGFCTPGMIMAAVALLRRNPHPTEEEVHVSLAGNICRCTGYEKICNAVLRAAEAGYGDRLTPGRNLCTEMRPVFEGDEADKFFSPRSLKEALDVLSSQRDVLILSGGTDIGPDTKGGRIRPVRVMDVFSVPEMNGIEVVGEGTDAYIRIGACATNTDIVTCAATRKHLPALVIASSRSGALAMQNRATIGGNICTASGAGDLPVALLALGALCVAAGPDAERIVALDDFITGYRKNVLASDELLKEIRVPMPAPGSRQVFYKRGSRKALTLSRASLAFYVDVRNGKIAAFRASAGSMSPVPIRLKNLSAAMPGRALSESLPMEAARLAYGDVNPRKTPKYRKTMIANLTHRFFSEVCEGVKA
ncbi:FAD binding domain-containing protein [Synergistaceae bacterium OttesenSCG-928-I11]|nr:FAD binding domain-containing protein [Synergistaceae bacterium OttesenSCG-928-I11]